MKRSQIESILLVDGKNERQKVKLGQMINWKWASFSNGQKILIISTILYYKSFVKIDGIKLDVFNHRIDVRLNTLF